MKPLVYSITQWNQIGMCQSNNSRELHVKCATISDNTFTGQCIRVYHDRFGCLFACMVENKGALISPLPDETFHMMKTQDILDELEKFGFIISFEPDEHLPGEQLEYLITLNNLHYDKIRILYVKYPAIDGSVTKKKIVVFKVANNPKWLTNTYMASKDEFTQALEEGSAVNITDMSQTKRFNWEFLDAGVLSIDDILRENANEN